MKRGVLGLFIVLTALVAAPSALAIATCGSVSSTDTLTANVSGTGTCITITGDDLVFDCLGNTITFDTSGGSYSSGILMANRRNVTIQNCVIRDPNGSSIGSIGINATNVNNSQILNNNIQTNGTNQSHGIVFFANSSNLFISNNTIDVYGSSQVSHGIYYVSFNPNAGQANNSLIVGNNITVRNGAIFYRSQFGANHTFANNTGLQFGGASNVQGFFVGVTNNVTLSGNNLTFNGTFASGHVTFSGTNYTNVTGNNFYFFNSTSLITATNNGFRHTWTDNMFFVSGPTTSSVLLTVNGINNTEIRNNTFYCDDGSCISAGGSVSGNVTISNNIFNSANASTFGGSTYMLSINGLENSALYHNILIQPSNSSAYREWTLQLAGVNLNFTNTTFMTSFGSVNYPFFAINSSQITGSRLNISDNRIRVDSASVPALNTSAQITLFNASPLSPGRLLVDYTDSGTYVPCSDCSNVQYFNNGTVQFNVTRFTSYSANDSFPAIINETSNLTTNITANGTAFNFTADDVVLDCNGNTIFYDANGEGNAGIVANNRDNITIRNCILVDVNSSSVASGILFSITSNSNISNTSVTTNASASGASGIVLSNSPFNTIEHNTITTVSTSSQSRGIVADASGSHTNTFFNNTISTSGSSSNFGIAVVGSNNSISYNTISTNGSSGNNWGIYVSVANFSNFTDNTIQTNGTTTNYGIFIEAAPHNLFENNNILTGGSGGSSYGIRIDFPGILRPTNNTFVNNNITITDTTVGTFGIQFDNTTGQFTNTIITSLDWIEGENGAQYNFTNTTFNTSYGLLRFPSLFQINDVKVINRTFVNISSNLTFVNSTNLSMLNQSAQITLHNVNTSATAVDFDDDGTFADCTTPQCVLESFNGSTIVFNVSSFTSYAAANLSTTASCPGVISSDTNLTENITVATSGACVSFGADNIVLDCQGYTMTGNGSGTGINATSRSNVEIRNCNVARFNRNILFSGTSNSRLLSSNTTNSTDINIFFSTSGSNNNLSNLVVNHNATTADAIQFFVAGTNQLRNISIFLRGTGGSGAGVYFFGSSDNSLDNLTSYAESTFYDHVQITSTALRNNVSNIVVSNGSMLSASTSSDFIRFNNARGTNSIVSVSTANNIIDNVTLTGSSSSQMFTASGTASNYSNINISNSGGQGVSIGGSTNRLINITTIGTIGMTVTGSTNILENIQSNATGIGQNSILISGSNNNVRNVTSQAGSGIGIGVSVASGNNISDFTVNEGYLAPISIQSGATNTIFTNGTINSNPTCSNCDGIALSALTNAILDNITIVSPVSSLFDWISTAASTSNASISNITFQTSSGSIKTIQNVTLPVSLNLNRNHLNISSNRSFLNSTNVSFLNSSAQITLHNVSTAAMAVDFDDDGTFVDCTTPQCVLESFNGSTIVFNVSSFTSYSAMNLSADDFPETISNDTTLDQNYTVNGSAFIINASNIVFDCNGTTITGNGSGEGINVTGQTNVTIQNCNIINFNQNIFFSGTTNSRLNNNNVTNSTIESIFLTSSSNSNNITNSIISGNSSTQESLGLFSSGSNIIENSNISGITRTAILLALSTNNIIRNINAQSISSTGIDIQSTSTGTNLTNVSIFNGTTGISVGSSNTRVTDMTIIGASVTGFSVSASTNGHVINNVSVNGTSSFGFLLGGNSYSIENIVSNATTGVQFGNGDSINLSNVISTGTTSQGVLITSGSDNNRLNNITSRSSSGAGLSVSTSNNNIITNYSSSSSTSNAVTVSGTGNVFSDGVANSNAAPAIVASTSGHSFNNTIINTNDDWFVTSSIATSTNITNTTFNDTDGSINHFANITLSNTTTISQAKLNITPNKAFLNSTNLSSLNTSAQITLNSVTSSVLLVDFEDDGTYQLCNATQCVLQSFNGSTAIFNVTSFTSYSTSSSGDADVTISKSDSPDPINLSNTTILNYQFTATVTNGTAYNLNITETYPGEVTFINATPSPDSGNNFWLAGNLTTGQNFNISIYVNVSTATANGTSIVNTIDTMFENSTGGMYNLSVSEATLVINEIEGQTNATITKTDSPDPLNISNTTLLTYQVNFTVTNGTAYNATIIETYSGNVTFVNATPTPTSGNNNWSVGNLTAPSVYQINITVNVSDSLANGSIVSNSVNATYENATGSSFNIDATAVTTILVDAAPANATIVTLTKTDSPDPLNISDTTLLTYQINFTVTNGTAINTTINETYPSNTTFVNATPTPTTGNTSWSAGNISAGTTYQINITLNVSSELSNGTILTNTVNTTYANATGSTLTANVQENTTVTRNLEFNATVITMTKTDAPDPVVAGQDLTYTININVTNGTAYNITLTDTYPSQVSFVSATPAANATNNTWIVGNLTIGESFQVNITVNVASGTANGTTINNSANISYANETGSILTLNATAQTLVSTQSFPIVINNNTNITTNGTTTGPGIIINSSNVTVSCNGNTITGSGSSVGVNITGFNNVTIQDCVFVNFATGAYIEDSNINQFTRNTFRSITNGVNLLGTSQNSGFNHTVIAASGDWVFTSAASSGNVFQNTSYNDTGGQIIITPSVTFAANTNASQSRLDVTSPDAFLNSTALPFLDAASRVTITGITNTATALILGDFDDDGTYEICSAPACTLISFASGTAIFDTTGWSSYTVVDGGVNFTLSKTSSPDPVVPGNNVVFTITATVNSGFAQNITVVESPPAELTFVTSTPTNISDNTWLLNNLSAGQSAQINVTYAVNSSFTGTIENNVSVTFQNSTNGSISANVSENTTAQTPAPSGGSGGGGGGGSSASICPPFCQYPENKDLPVCRNNCPPAQAPIQSDFGSMFPPVSDVVPPTIEEPVEEPVVEEVVVEETPVEEPKPVKSKFFPWWYVLIAIIAIVFMIWETHNIVSKIHKPSKEQSKLDKIDKDIIRMRKMLKKK